MELVGAISAREWNSLSGIYSSDQEADHRHNDNQFVMASHDDFLADHHHHSVVDQNYLHLTNGASSLENPFPIFTSEGSTSHYLSGIFADSYHNSSNTSNIFSHDQQLTLAKHNSAPLALCEDGIVTRNADLFLNIEGDHGHQCLNQDMMSNNGNYGGNNQPAAVYNATLLHKEVGMESGSRSRNYMKRSRSTPITPAEHGQDSKNKRNVRPRKSCTQKLPMSDNGEDANVEGPISPNSSCSAGEYSYEELGGIDLSSSTPKGFPALNLNGKARATRGSATDPQSVYARKRREKINERLKILQNLVPNGTKVDISTMLEEAVQYVKFLELQIKLLSSDDLWMYAPLAYNGMDIGLDFNISATPRE